MRSKRNPRSASSEILATETFFGPPPILPEEDLVAYRELLASVSRDVHPIDIIEDIWVRDVVDLTWEILRWRRIKSDLVAQAIPAALRSVLSGLLPKPLPSGSAPPLGTWEHTQYMIAKSALPLPGDELVKKWVKRSPRAIKQVNKLLSSANMTMANVVTNASIEELENIERIDRLITVTEARRNAVYREIDRHRSVFSRALRNKVHEIEDAEFETIEPETISPKIAVEETAA